MNVEQLRVWLGLPPGDWPPEPAELFGTPSNTTAEQAEQAALKLMSKLRPHQLLHPELVTEGMNRLAQALLAFRKQEKQPRTTSSAVNSQEPSTPHNQQDAEFIPFDFSPANETLSQDHHYGSSNPTIEQILADGHKSYNKHEVLEAEVLETYEQVYTKMCYHRWHSARTSRVRSELRPTVEVPEQSTVEISSSILLNERRRIYRTLCHARRVQAAWRKLGPFAGNPEQQLSLPSILYQFRCACDQFQKVTNHPDVLLITVEPIGSITLQLFLQERACVIFQSLTLIQRHKLSKDWAKGMAAWNAVVSSIRKDLRETKKITTIKPRRNVATLRLFQVPEFLVVVSAIVFVLTILIRYRELFRQ